MLRLFYSLFFLIILCGCGGNKNEITPIIPAPNSIEKSSGTISLSNAVLIATNEDSTEILAIAKNLGNFIESHLGKTVFYGSKGSSDELVITLSMTNSSGLVGNEGYQLEINNDGVELSSESYHGLFNSVQSLKHIMLEAEDNAELTKLTVNDSPTYEYRGMMLDVSRHFFTVEEVKRYLDLMSFYKLNKFHWHLTDDQGWRIEIKQYPLLTEIGAIRHETMVDKNYEPYIGDGVPHSGFYSQEDIKEVVQYAAERYIEVIPEIDMPGHAVAALAAYPELACEPRAFEVSTIWGVHKDVMCPTESTFTFLENVLSEVIELFPSRYIHLGGDEVPTTRWSQSNVAQSIIQEKNLTDEASLQGYFFDRMSNFLAAQNKLVIGWDEVLEKGIQSTPTVMIWRDLSLISQAEEQQAPIILTPRDYTYFDYYQDNQSSEPIAQCCMLTAKDVYHMPTTQAALGSANILGGQGQIWTAFIKTESHLQYMTLPRMLALSEVLWTGDSEKNWNTFKRKLAYHYQYFDRINANYKML